MRTTITIPDELLQETLKISGKKRLSEAVVTSLKDYVALKKRLNFLNDLFNNKVPHSLQKIKQKRRNKKWS